jgi:hypothetical protein
MHRFNKYILFFVSFLQSLNGFMVVISRKGILNFATDAVTTLLGHKLVSGQLIPALFFMWETLPMSRPGQSLD